MVSAEPSISPRASGWVLPCSLVISAASSSRRTVIRSATSLRIEPRLMIPSASQECWAVTAAKTASSTSAGLHCGKLATTSLGFAGFMLSSMSPRPAAHLPPIRFMGICTSFELIADK